jgi:predicted outer membrane protein
MRIIIALVVALAVHAGAANAADETPAALQATAAPQANSEIAPGQPAANEVAAEQVVCRDRQRTGTRFARRVCRTQAQGDAEQEAARDAMGAFLAGTGHNNSVGD